MKTTHIFYGLLVISSIQFGIVGLLKIVGYVPLYQQLTELHISPSLGLFIGITEVLGVIGLWLPSTRKWALIGLLYLSVSAIAIHFGAAVPLYKALPAIISTLFLATQLYLSNLLATNSSESPAAD